MLLASTRELMQTPDPLSCEAERLKALFQQSLLDSPAEPEFDQIVALAAAIFGVKIALVSLVDDCRQWFKAKVGLTVTETPRQISFCTHAIQGDDIFEIPDAHADERFQNNPLVTGEPYIRFYAGQPIHTEEGYKIGTLCLIDSEPRQLTASQREQLRLLTQQVEQFIRLRRTCQKDQQQIAVLKTRNQSLQRDNSHKDHLLAVLSHDLRSPLVSFRGLMELQAVDALTPEELESFIAEISTQFEHLEAKVSQTLDWVQKQLQTQDVAMEVLSLEAIAKEALSWCQDRAQQKNIALQTEVPLNVKVLGNLELTVIVLRNLLLNAVKYSRQGDSVTLFAAPEGPDMILGVKDTGLGMKPETLKKIRSATYQHSTPGTDNERGTGLGLLLCQTYLNQMGTVLDIESRWLEGSTLSFRLAIASEMSLA